MDDGSPEKRDVSYPLIKARAFRKKYASDCYSGFFEPEYLNASCGFEDLKSFDDIYPTLNDYNQMNSFMIADFKGKLLANINDTTSDEYDY